MRNLPPSSRLLRQFASVRPALVIVTDLCIAFSCACFAQQAGSRSGYTVVELPTLGGTVGAATSVNDAGWISGYANLPGDRTEHGFYGSRES